MRTLPKYHVLFLGLVSGWSLVLLSLGIGKDEVGIQRYLNRDLKYLLSRPQSSRVRGAIFACVLLACGIVASPQAMSAPSMPPGIWLMDTKVAIQVFDCNEMLCGRVIWLKAPLDPQGILKRDKLNPDPVLRERQVCGPTIIWNLQSAAPGHWKGGYFYNPDDGRTYKLTMELQSNDIIAARIYVGFPIFGETKTLTRIPIGIGTGWCG